MLIVMGKDEINILKDTEAVSDNAKDIITPTISTQTGSQRMITNADPIFTFEREGTYYVHKVKNKTR